MVNDPVTSAAGIFFQSAVINPGHFAVCITRRKEQAVNHLLHFPVAGRVCLSDLVKFLAHSAVDAAERDSTWHHAWVRDLAQTLAAELLPEEYQEPDEIDQIARRLNRHTLLKIDRIADLLAYASIGDELEALLLKDEDQVRRAEFTV